MAALAMDVKVIGAGLAGLAVAEALLSRGVRVILYDKSGVAAAASGAAAGLLHPLPARAAKIGWRAREAFQLSRASVLQRAARDPKIICGRGVWRPDPRWANQHCAELAQQLERPPQQIASLVTSEGWWFADGLVIDTPRYCRAWLLDLQERGLTWYCGVQPLESVDHTVLCTGAELARLMPARFSIVRGQALVLQRDGSMPSIGVAGPIYLAPQGEQLVVGSTFEHDRSDLEPSLETAQRMLGRRLEAFWQGEFPWGSIKSILVGLRCTNRSKLPCLGYTDKGELYLGGLGSKGILYHYLMGQLAAEALLAESLSILPREIVAV